MFSTPWAIWIALGLLPGGLQVEPSTAELRGSDSRVQIVVVGRSLDLTGSVHYVSLDPGVARVDDRGQIQPTGDGSTEIEITEGGQSARLTVQVSDFANLSPVSFVGEVVPILTRFGCNSGGCHGKSSGQNGFRLSLLGFEPRADHDSLVQEGRGRRVFPTAPEASLLLRKPTGQVPHGGGRRFAVGSPEYQTIARWVGQGMPFETGTESTLISLTIGPQKQVVPRKARQQVRVVARRADGSNVDVTRLAQYQSNAPDLAEVDQAGVIQALGGVGEAAITARFGGMIAVTRMTIPSGREVVDREKPTHFIDRRVSRKLLELGLTPSATCTDAEFARRSSIDIRGTLPRPSEVVALEIDSNPDKRTRWVDRLLDQPEYADLFAMKWSTILRNQRKLGEIAKPGSFAFHGWIRQSIAENKPFDQFVAEILGARGDAATNPPVVWYRQVSSLEDRVDDTAQLFLGVRLQCARCHHHPFENWSQDDYYGFASFFARVGTKPGLDPTTPRIFNLPSGLARNPVTNEFKRPKLLGSLEVEDLGPAQDPRSSLIAWIKQPHNPYFARSVVNRYWNHFLGRGLVEPEDDFRVGNPPSDPDLLDDLARDFIESGYDLKRLVKTIATSQTYQRSSLPNDSNAVGRRDFARFYPRRLPAEILLDAIDRVAGTHESFLGLPEGFRATQLPDNGFASPFLDIFGRPSRETACECERSDEANLSQTLHLLNSDQIQDKLAQETGRAARLVVGPRSDADKSEELYRVALARRPTEEEKRDCLAFLERRRAEGQLREGFEDLLWSLINTKEFLFNH